MPELEPIMQMITQGLFPAAMCLILVWYLKSTVDPLREAIASLEIAISQMSVIVQEYHRKE